LRVVGIASMMAHYRTATGAPAGDPSEPATAVGREIPAAVTLALFAAAVTANAPSAPGPPAERSAPSRATREPLSRRIVSYVIEASLDPARGAVRGRETITYRNDTRLPMEELQFHLYPNAFSNTRSTYMRGIPWSDDAALARVERLARERSWGAMKVASVRLTDGADLTGSAVIDDTVMKVALPRPVPPGDSARVRVEWETILP